MHRNRQRPRADRAGFGGGEYNADIGRAWPICRCQHNRSCHRFASDYNQQRLVQTEAGGLQTHAGGVALTRIGKDNCEGDECAFARGGSRGRNRSRQMGRAANLHAGRSRTDTAGVGEDRLVVQAFGEISRVLQSIPNRHRLASRQIALPGDNRAALEHARGLLCPAYKSRGRGQIVPQHDAPCRSPAAVAQDNLIIELAALCHRLRCPGRLCDDQRRRQTCADGALHAPPLQLSPGAGRGLGRRGNSGGRDKKWGVEQTGAPTVESVVAQTCHC